jgi:sulfur-oxidizing protein SoxX
MASRALVLVGSALGVAAGVALASGAGGNDAAAGKALRASFASASPEWLARIAQDAMQKACSRYRNAPPKAVADAIRAQQKAAIVYPPDGKLIGDWKKGERLAESGYGGRYTDVPPRSENGGNCYACHQLDARELSYGTIGPSLTGYGSIRKFAPAEVTAVYERIYNPDAAVACSNMPRFGSNGFLTIAQIRDLVAYVMSPDSPVNH